MKASAIALFSLLMVTILDHVKSQAITSLVLMNTVTVNNTVIGSLNNGDTLSLTALPSSWTIHALATSATKSMVFNLDGNATYRIENSAPWSMHGPPQKGWNPVPLGGHSLNITPYPQKDLVGTPGPAYTISFTVVASGSVVPTQAPTKAPVALPTTQAPTTSQAPTQAPTTQAPTTQAPTKAPTPLSPTPLPVCALGAPCITKLVLINAANGTRLQNLTDGDTIYFSEILTSISIEAQAVNAAKVQFDLDGKINHRTESSAPYALFGDKNGGTTFTPWTNPTGPHILSVKAINGLINSTLYTISFTVSEENHFLSHAVAGGPYTAVDTDGDNVTAVALDGTGSHTHRFPGSLTSFSWREDNVQFSTLESPTHEFTVGVHYITLVVEDSGGQLSTDSTTVTVLPATTPDIADLIPNAGDIVGGYAVEIVGSGFDSVDPANITVNFNGVPLTGTQILSIDSNTIIVMAPPTTLPMTAPVTVSTPTATSAPKAFTYTDSSLPNVTFTQGNVFEGIEGPTAVAFGPDRKLYVGTQGGKLYKLTLNAQYQVTNIVGPSEVLNNIYGGWRSILGMTFHPGSTDHENPEVYVSHSQLFHGQYDGYIGVVSKVGGANFTNHTEVISGLPVSAADHGVNGMDFGDGGELYIMVGSHTAAGIPGK
jgi:IPT/TIG domain